MLNVFSSIFRQKTIKGVEIFNFVGFLAAVFDFVKKQKPNIFFSSTLFEFKNGKFLDIIGKYLRGGIKGSGKTIGAGGISS